MNEFQQDLSGTPARTLAERHIEAIRQHGGIFVDAVRLTRMPMIVTDATLPGNPIIFANQAFAELSGYSLEDLLGQDPHFMNGPETDPATVQEYEAAIRESRNATLEILQYCKDGKPFRAMLFASPLDDGQGTVTNHFLSYLDITRRVEAEKDLQELTAALEQRVADRTRELEAVNERLTKLAAEREMLLVEVNHRAKNSLSIAGALLSLQGRRQADPAVKALFAETQERLNAMARAHDLLSRSDHVQQVNAGGYVADLCAALEALTESDDRIQLEAQVEEGIFVSADRAIPLGLALTELVTNAVKYAFPPPRSGTIRAQVRRSQPGRVELVIQDNGVGMAGVREGSLGYSLIRSLVQQIEGDIDIRSDAGVIVTISFPDLPPHGGAG
ncbi:histidine kinase dimerization/phosphoacceptor domain -containing protein [Methylorubrum extorquens]|uniref:histidine kinase dimerization/phosphoacceptor domain -containing protein n=1 Tax=Methylorubrum extorquens TaxID=408 RepID=UPI000158F0B9|nr:histidine kinase dimerization/phosphoacceptor domain -containing protein [Methylorubrum extorquens]ABY30293.1 PAS sensor protein [Methylorubrum extorquens PA1]KQP89274.1 histidine kinase [Methylobacterium sp. Leaf119]WIU41592.1 PAS domain-containing protein [Methylorubrum extorquens]